MNFSSLPHPYDNNENYLLWIGFSLSCSAILATIFMFGSISTGDAEIYFVFGKSMWESGIFHYGYMGPVGGATSPIWAFIISLLYLFNLPPLLFGRAITFIIFVGSGLVIFKFAEKITEDLGVAAIAVSVWLLNPMVRYFAVIPYETMLGILLISVFLIYIYILSSKTNLPIKSLIVLGLTIGALGLTRPDSAILVGIGLFYLLWDVLKSDSKKITKLLIPILVGILVISPYYIYLFVNSGDIIPSSLRARSWYYGVRYSQFSIIERLIFQFEDMFLQTKNLIQNLPLFILVILSIPAVLKKQSKYLSFLLFSSIIFILFYLIKYPFSNFERYTLILTPYLAVLSAISLKSLINKILDFGDYRSLLNVSIAIIILSTLITGVLFPVLIDDLGIGSDPDEIGDKSYGEMVNSNSDPHDKILIREIQHQYHIDIQTISADGIVGGEILPYLRNDSKKVSSFIREHNITLISNYGPYGEKKEYDGTLFEEFDEKIKKEHSEFTIQGLTFIRVSEEDNLYCIEYDNHSCDHHVETNKSS